MSPMNNRRMTPMAEPGILDFAPGAAAAYSLRNLSSTYVGPVVTVRRSTDDAERDFTASEVSDGTLAAWCGGGDGFVKQWWSQTGSSHASQSTAGYQPQLVSAGVVILEGGKPALQFDGTDDSLVVAGLLSIQSKQYKAIFFIGSAANNANRSRAFYVGTGASTRVSLFKENQTTFGWTGNTFANAVYASFAPPSLYAYHAADYSGAQSLSVDAGLASTNLLGGTSNDADTALLGGYSIVGSQHWDGKMQEFLVYYSDMTALRDRITADQMWYF